MLRLEEVQSAAQKKEFIELPYRLYRDEKNWTPPLRMTIEELLDIQKHPFYRHAKSCFFICRNSSGEVVGRVAGFVDETHNDFHQEKAAFFGFIEGVDNKEVFIALVSRVEKWAKEQGMEFLRGPFQLNSNYESGLLVNGFDDSNCVGMPYHFSYYARLIEACGLSKEKDLLAYYVFDRKGDGNATPEILVKHFERSLKKNQIRFRQLQLDRFDEEIGLAFEVYNSAWEKNWGFVPVDEKEFRFIAKDMKLVMDPRLAYFVEVEGKIAGFSLALPDIHQIQKKIRNGKLFPIGWIRLLLGLKAPGLAKRVGRLRVLALGAKKEYEHLGLGALMYANYFIEGQKLGYRSSECSWILEDNIPMTRAIQRIGGEPLKTYRVYRKDLKPDPIAIQVG